MPETPESSVAEIADEAATVLHSFATALVALGRSKPPRIESATAPTPRNWWKLQAGRFKDDPTFPEFIAQVQAARKHGD